MRLSSALSTFSALLLAVGGDCSSQVDDVSAATIKRINQALTGANYANEKIPVGRKTDVLPSPARRNRREVKSRRRTRRDSYRPVPIQRWNSSVASENINKNLVRDEEQNGRLGFSEVMSDGSTRNRRQDQDQQQQYHTRVGGAFSFQDSMESIHRRRREGRSLQLPPGQQDGSQNKMATAELACSQAAQEEEEFGVDFGTTCSCDTDPGVEIVTLTCTDIGCGYCNEEETVCARFSFGMIYDIDGYDFQYFEIDDYITGLEGTISYVEDFEGCGIAFDETWCTSCAFVDCDAEGISGGMEVSCENVPDGESFSTCDVDSGPTGVFEAYNEDEFGYCFSTYHACERDLEKVDSNYECQCKENEEIPNTLYAMECTQDDCEILCNSDMSICLKEEYRRFYEMSLLAVKQTILTYTKGRTETVVYEEFDCDSNTGVCSGCHFFVDDEECTSCTMQTCANGESKPLLDCRTIDPTAQIDFCAPGDLDGSMFEYFDDQLLSCSSRAEQKCLEDEIHYETNGDGQGYTCSCEPANGGKFELQCESDCDLCNEADDVCVRESFVKGFSQTGSYEYFEKDMEYTLGFRGVLTFVEYADETCELREGNTVCNSCNFQRCDDGTTKPLLDCTNFPNGMVMDLCDPTLHIDEGIFQRFSNRGYRECVDKTPANHGCASASLLSLTDGSQISASGSTIMITSGMRKSCAVGSSTSPGLWYKIVGEGKPLFASVCEGTDFEAQISILAAPCSSATCVEGTAANSCNLQWLAEEGKTYFIRVHGIGEQVGNFNLHIEETTASVACSAKNVEVANLPFRSHDCDCIFSTDLQSTSLRCEESCPLCDGHGETCGHETKSWDFDATGNAYRQMDTFTFAQGISFRSEEIVVDKLNCQDGSDCSECMVSIDGAICEACSMITCPQGGEAGIEIACVDAGGPASFNSCSSHTAETAGPFHFLTDPNFGMCFTRDPALFCEEHKLIEEAKSTDVVCNCSPRDVNGHVAMTCVHEDCLLCNTMNSVCGFKAFGTTFNGNQGHLLSRHQGFQYVMGRDSLVVFHENLDHSTSSCRATVDDRECNSCHTVECFDSDNIAETDPTQMLSLFGFGVDCMNLPSGTVFTAGCGPVSLSESDEFTFLSEFQGFTECQTVDDPAEVCRKEKDDSIANRPAGSQVTCTCDEQPNGGYELSCTETSECRYCRNNGNGNQPCAAHTRFGVSINPFGLITSRLDTFQYIVHRSETMVIEDHSGTSCKVFLDERPCQACDVIDCDDPDSFPYDVDCSNIVRNAKYTCGQGNGHGIFSVLQPDQVDYVCPASPPSAAPSDPPTSFPTESPSMNPTVKPSNIPSFVPALFSGNNTEAHDQTPAPHFVEIRPTPGEKHHKVPDALPSTHPSLMPTYVMDENSTATPTPAPHFFAIRPTPATHPITAEPSGPVPSSSPSLSSRPTPAPAFHVIRPLPGTGNHINVPANNNNNNHEPTPTSTEGLVEKITQDDNTETDGKNTEEKNDDGNAANEELSETSAASSYSHCGVCVLVGCVMMLWTYVLQLNA